MSWETLPKFLLCRADAEESHAAGEQAESLFVLHTQRPRFLMEFVPGGEGEFRAIDEASDEEWSALKREARTFFRGEPS